MPASYDKNPEPISVTQASFRLEYRGQLDGNLEFPTVASDVTVRLRVFAPDQRPEDSGWVSLDSLGLAGVDLSDLRAASDKVKDAIMQQVLGYTPTP